MKFLFCGLGSIGQRHVRLIKTIIPEARIFAYRTHSGTPKDIEKFQKQFNIRTYSSINDALAQKPTVAFITNPTSLHIKTALVCAKAGLDIFIEKPLAHSTDGVAELEKIITKKKIIVTVGYMMRYNLGLLKIKELLSQKVIGNILSAQIINGEYLPKWHPWENYRISYSSKKELGGGIIFNFSHELDYASWLFGKPKKVYCISSKNPLVETGVEDCADMLITIGSIPVSIHLDHVSQPPIRQAIILGERGAIHWDFYKSTVNIKVAQKKDEVYVYDSNRDLMFLKELQEFIFCIKSRKQPTLNFTSAKENLTLLLACHESARTNKHIIL